MRAGLGLLSVTLAVAVACGGDAVPETTGAPATSLRFATVDTATVAMPLELPSQLYVEHDAFVYARSEGVVEAVRAELGERVRTGQVLARLEDVDQTIALEEAEASHENALRVLQRVRELAGTGVVSVADSDKAELDARKAELAVRQARRDLELTRAVAPFSGVVTARAVRPGRFVEEFEPLFRVTALRPLRASAQVPEQFGIPAPGDSARVIALDGTVVDATVERASPTVDPTSGTREVIVRLTPESELSPGTTVRIRLGTQPRRVVVIPADAIAEEGYVLVWGDGRTVLRAVTLGATLPDGRLEVLNGVELGERLVRSAP